jgi:hypothetical protein
MLSVTVSVKAELVALQSAATSAVTLPPAMAMLLMVTPAPLKGVAVTETTVDGLSRTGLSGSKMVAMVELDAALPCCRVSGPAALMVGAVLTAQVKLVLVVVPQLSVAVTVTV